MKFNGKSVRPRYKILAVIDNRLWTIFAEGIGDAYEQAFSLGSNVSYFEVVGEIQL